MDQLARWITLDHTRSALMARVRERIRVKHYSIRTEQAYCDWIKRFIVFHGKRHPATWMAMRSKRSSLIWRWRAMLQRPRRTRPRPRFCSFIGRRLGLELPWLDAVQQARTPLRLPVVLTRDEVHLVLTRLRGVHALIGSLLYGTGLRIMEGVRLRVKDVDFDRRQVIVRDGKGFKDRITMLPDCLAQPLWEQLDLAQGIHRKDLADGNGHVWAATCTGPQISACRAHVGLAVRLSRRCAFVRSA
jgi:integrase